MALSEQLAALSNDLTQLTARAKEAEEHTTAARNKSKAELNADVETARASAQAQAKKLRESAEANKNKLSVWWYDLQRTWNEHVAKIREDIDAKRAEHDVDRAQHRAESKAEDAAFAVNSHTPRSRRQSTPCSTPNWRGWRRTTLRRLSGFGAARDRSRVPGAPLLRLVAPFRMRAPAVECGHDRRGQPRTDDRSGDCVAGVMHAGVDP